MSHYLNTKIYYILVNDEKYYGHTTDIVRRTWEHKSRFRNGCQFKLYQAMRKNNMNEDDINLIVVYEFSCKGKSEAELVEKQFIQQEGQLNMLFPSNNQYYKTQEYKDKRNERRRNTIWHCDICDCDIKGDHSAFVKHTETQPHKLKVEGKWDDFVEEQRKKTEERLRKEREYNKLKFRQMITHCDFCNCDIKGSNFSTHLKTLKHINNIRK